jgi:AraC family transcriptional regulator of adaptative response/methylated-DNA-[protein]-cysteine methyltransferase
VPQTVRTTGFGSARAASESSSLGRPPARFRKGGRGERIGFATAPSTFGSVVIGSTARGICWLSLAASAAEAEASLRQEFPLAELLPDPTLAPRIEDAIASIQGRNSIGNPEIDLRGTTFQLRVWQALCTIPRGQTRSYSQLARELGAPRSARAVARACATNRVALLVPCHRVIGVSGSLAGYRWGIERKRRLLEAETSAKPPNHA